MAIRRSDPYIWVTWLTKLLSSSGDISESAPAVKGMFSLHLLRG
jgi:hypothetical protein